MSCFRLTKPNNFKLETFINNLTAPGSKSSSFSKFCDVNYDDAFHNHTTVPASPSAQTDVLVIKGRYKVCSVCVYGTIQQYKLPNDPQGICWEASEGATFLPIFKLYYRCNTGVFSLVSVFQCFLLFLKTSGVGVLDFYRMADKSALYEHLQSIGSERSCGKR